uniref:Uncharacterized protein n=1 Tax=Plectus sambesii TaxID=2011161 RepID=A0A914X1J5_9BILA
MHVDPYGTLLTLILHFRVRNRQRSSSGRTHSGGAADDKVRFPIVSSANLTAKVDAPNGHARSTSPDKVYEHRGADLPPSSSHINNNDAKHSNANDRWPLARRLSSSPLPVRQHLSYSPGLQQRAPRNRHNFPIDLHKFNSALRRRAQTPPASISQSSPVVNCVNCAKCSSDGGHGVVRPKSLVEAATCSQLTNHSGIFASVDRLHSLRYIDSTTADDAKNEHRLIAFKSALLKTPSYSQTHAGRASCSRANSLAANSKTSLVTDRVTAMIHEEESVHPDHSTGDTTVGAAAAAAATRRVETERPRRVATRCRCPTVGPAISPTVTLEQSPVRYRRRPASPFFTPATVSVNDKIMLYDS